ncbi:ABC transporter ATP-binding protein, partial [Rhizobium ruizarguesonis]
VTHMCERLAVMRNGAVVERLSSQELFDFRKTKDA